MGNRTSLAALNEPLICPGYRSDTNYDEESQSVGDTAWSIPFIWLGLFREDDLIEQDVPFGRRESKRIMAPIAAREKALEQLDRSRTPLRTAFPEAPQLSQYIDFMLEEVSQFKHRFFTVEVVEIESVYPPGYFRRYLRHCLRGFANPAAVESWPKRRSIFRRLLGQPAATEIVSWRSALSVMSGLKTELPIPPADILLRE